MLGYTYHHGIRMLSLEEITLENPEELGKLRLIWIRRGERKRSNYNWKKFTLQQLFRIERIVRKVSLYAIEAIEIVYVDFPGNF